MYKRKKYLKSLFNNNIFSLKENKQTLPPIPSIPIEKVEGNGFNSFDIVYYINLKHRADRLEQIKSELKKTNIDENKIIRIEAVDIPYFGQLGCTKSHILALEEFLKTPPHIQNCLILEDDFEFIVDQITVNNSINYFFKYFKNYNVLMLSSNIFQSNNSHHPYIDRIYEAKTTSGYCVNKNYASKLLKNYKTSEFFLQKSRLIHNFSIDIYIKILQRTGLWYSFNPKIAKQRASYSDIEKKNTDYNC